MPKLLDDYAKVPQVAEEFGKCPRTITRWMDKPDGLPFIYLGKERIVHIPTAREWLLGRMHRRNPRRRAEGRHQRTST
jgi:hypothetical protein